MYLHPPGRTGIQNESIPDQDRAFRYHAGIAQSQPAPGRLRPAQCQQLPGAPHQQGHGPWRVGARNPALPANRTASS